VASGASAGTCAWACWHAVDRCHRYLVLVLPVLPACIMQRPASPQMHARRASQPASQPSEQQMGQGCRCGWATAGNTRCLTSRCMSRKSCVAMGMMHCFDVQADIAAQRSPSAASHGMPACLTAPVRKGTVHASGQERGARVQGTDAPHSLMHCCTKRALISPLPAQQPPLAPTSSGHVSCGIMIHMASAARAV
jgi:hypothetical protein